MNIIKKKFLSLILFGIYTNVISMENKTDNSPLDLYTYIKNQIKKLDQLKGKNNKQENLKEEKFKLIQDILTKIYTTQYSYHLCRFYFTLEQKTLFISFAKNEEEYIFIGMIKFNNFDYFESLFSKKENNFFNEIEPAIKEKALTLTDLKLDDINALEWKNDIINDIINTAFKNNALINYNDFLNIQSLEAYKRFLQRLQRQPLLINEKKTVLQLIVLKTIEGNFPHAGERQFFKGDLNNDNTSNNILPGLKKPFNALIITCKEFIDGTNKLIDEIKNKK